MTPVAGPEMHQSMPSTSQKKDRTFLYKRLDAFAAQLYSVQSYLSIEVAVVIIIGHAVINFAKGWQVGWKAEWQKIDNNNNTQTHGGYLGW